MKTLKNKNTLLILLVCIGIIIRLYLQFITPCFNGDEILLGNKIKFKGFIELLYPLSDYQSAPPLYLWIQKVIIQIKIPFWISIKLLSTVVSILILFYAYLLAKSFFENVLLQFVFVSFFVFNPFIVYHTLTLKQYGLDLLLYMVLLKEYNLILKKYSLVFFLIWCLISNVGLFFSAGIVLFRFIEKIRRKEFKFLPFLTNNHYSNLKIMVGSIVYIVYFLWYKNQSGYTEIRLYMESYWKANFIPLDLSIFKHGVLFLYSVLIYFINFRIYLAIILSVLIALALFKNSKYSELNHIYKISFSAIFIHIILNICHLYPLGDRLFLYFAPIVYLMLVLGLEFLKNRGIKFFILGITLIGINLMSFIDYLPYRENDVLHLSQLLKTDKYKNKTIYMNGLANKDIRSFLDFTEGQIIDPFPYKLYRNDTSDQGIYVTRVYHFIGYLEKSTLEYDSTIDLKLKKRITLIDQIDGYNIYKLQAKQ